MFTNIRDSHPRSDPLRFDVEVQQVRAASAGSGAHWKPMN